MNVIATIKLAPGERFFYDKLSNIFLNQKKKQSYIYNTDNVTGIYQALLQKKIILVNGTLNIEEEKSSIENVPEIPSNSPPIIYGVSNLNVFINQEFNPMKGVRAMDNKKNDITKNVRIEGLVDVNTPGIYTLVYTVSDVAGNITTAERVVTVLDNIAPIFTGIEDVEITLGQEFDPLAGVSATDNVDGIVTSAIKVSKK